MSNIVDDNVIYAKSEITENYYKISKYKRVDEKRVLAIDKQEVEKSDVPEKWVKRIEGEA